MAGERHGAVVVGFGPCGATAAAMLGQAGFERLVFDRARNVYAKPRAIALDHKILRMFDSIGVVDAVLPHCAPFPASEHFGADGQLIRCIDMVPEPYPLAFVPTMVLSQPPVEAALRAHAAATPGVTVELGTESVDIAVEGDSGGSGCATPRGGGATSAPASSSPATTRRASCAAASAWRWTIPASMCRGWWWTCA